MSRNNGNFRHCSRTKLKKWMHLKYSYVCPLWNWETAGRPQSLGLSSGWERTRAGTTVDLNAITPLVGAPVLSSFEHFLSLAPRGWIKCTKKCDRFANDPVTLSQSCHKMLQNPFSTTICRTLAAYFPQIQPTAQSIMQRWERPISILHPSNAHVRSRYNPSFLKRESS